MIYFKNLKTEIKILIVGVIVAVLFFVGILMMSTDFFRVDSCMDRGGTWDYDLSRCETLEITSALDKKFQLKVNQTAFIASENMRIKFLVVREDSRCASDVQCFWEGEAKAAISITRKGEEASEIVVSTMKSAYIFGYSIELVDLKPYPHSKIVINPSDYTGTFVLSKSPTPETLIEETQGIPDIELTSKHVILSNGTEFDVKIASGFDIAPAFEGLGRIRFMAMSPDGRLFLTDMKNLSDNYEGRIYVLEDFDNVTRKFQKITTYLSGLRNPNSVAFYTAGTGTHWLYIALTDSLIRYRYELGDTAPISEPEILAKFPAYGLSYKYGGWHLTRTVAFHNDKAYVSIGSSCNACEEREDEIRAAIIEMNPDGTGQRIYAEGLRNAVGIKWAGDKLYATAMGADHLGDDVPDDLFYVIEDGVNYGWPYCYEDDGKVLPDTSKEWEREPVDCSLVPKSVAGLGAHVAPLGLEFFNMPDTNPILKNTFLIGLHGSGNVEIGNGYSIVRVDREGDIQEFVTGFFENGKRLGRPVDIMQKDKDSFFFTDDFAGVMYYVFKDANF